MNQKQILLDWKILSYYSNSLWKKEWVFIFLHGWMQDGKSFEWIFKILEEKNIPYISLDLPWFGNSQLRHDDMTIEEYGEVVIECIQKLWLKNPSIIGHSFGWRISIYIGSFYENISKIVLIGSAGISTKMNPFKLAIVKTWKTIFSLPWLKNVWNKIKNKNSSQDALSAGKMSKIFKNTISNDLQNYMKLISLPTLMIWWKDDDQVTIGEAKVMHSHIENSNLQILEWSHFIHQEEIEQVNNLILEFTQK